MFDAYTVKKVLPRLVIAAILIQLSWEIFTFLMTLVSQIAWGIEGLFYAPLGGREALQFRDLISNSTGGAGFFSLLATTGVITAGATAISGGYVFLLALTAVLGLTIAFFVLVIRQVVLLALLVTAPLALVAWILPNTEKVWKVWWESFSKLLLMYPLILLLIAVGRVFAYVTTGISDVVDAGGAIDSAAGIASMTSRWSEPAIVVIGYFGPYFLIPKTFQVAGSAFANITGMINDRGRGAFDRLKKGRQQSIATTANKARNYGRFSDRNRLTRGLNRAVGAGINPRDAVHGSAGIAAGQRRGRALLGQEALKNDATFQANQNDDNFLLALANENLAKQKLKAKETEHANAVNRFGVDSEQARSAQADIDVRKAGLDAAALVRSRGSSSTQLTALNALAKTGYQFQPGEAGYNELSQTARAITGDDDAAYRATMNEAQYHLKGAGRFDLGGINHGSGYDYRSGVDKASGYMAGNAKIDTHIAGAQNLVGNSYKKAGVIEERDATGNVVSTSSMADELASGVANGSIGAQALVEHHDRLLDALPGATGGNKREIEAQIGAVESLLQSNVVATSRATAGNMTAAVDGIVRNKQARLAQRSSVDPNVIEGDS